MASVVERAQQAASIVADAGGQLVGRTRFQKIAYLLEVAGLGDGFDFEYRHYGPFSEALAESVSNATLLGLLGEEKRATSWGGVYSVYQFDNTRDHQDARPDRRRELISELINTNSVQLELAATAVFLDRKNYDDPWEEVSRRKPEKSSPENLAGAKALLASLDRFDVSLSEG